MLTETIDLPQPRSAWLLLGDEASYPPGGFHSKDDGPWYWTACPHVEVGDTLFFYFMAPRKAIHFIGRALARPYVDLELEVTSHRKVDRHQWFVDYDAVIEIEPIPLNEINTVCGERLLLRGRSGKPIRTDAANRLLGRARVVYSSEPWRPELALEEVIGRSELPSPSQMNRQMLCELPSSLLRLESDVEEFVVEPLFRLLRLPQAYRLQRRLPLRPKVADYAILKNGKPHCIIEAKLRTCLDRDRNWRKSPDVRQARAYARNFGARFLVIDCDEVFCFGPTDAVPRLMFDRRELSNEDMAAIREHIMGSN